MSNFQRFLHGHFNRIYKKKTKQILHIEKYHSFHLWNKLNFRHINYIDIISPDQQNTKSDEDNDYDTHTYSY